MIHESDLAPYGVAGMGLTHVEHYVAKSKDEAGRNDYGNCFYACGMCNMSKGIANAVASTRRLLNPCTDVWAEHFESVRDEVQPRSDSDGDAAYTEQTYRLNDPRKKRMRRMRRLTINQCIEFLVDSRHIERALLQQVRDGGQPMVAQAWRCSRLRRKAKSDLRKFAPLPHDRDRTCRCGHTAHHRLPAVVADQLLDIRAVMQDAD